MMEGSYTKINYGLRPSKAVERKMLCEAFRKLYVFGKLELYRYIGFGSTYFSDFILFHKALGIKNMLSIEKDIENRKRFEFNLPYKCINIEFGESVKILPRLNWDIRTILWLDYDHKLNSDALADIKYFCTKAVAGSILVVTVNAEPKKLNGEYPQKKLVEQRYNELQELVGKEKIPYGTSGKNLSGWGLAKVSANIVKNEILETLNERNGGREPGSKIVYEQLFNFNYADGAKMVTTGGLFYDEGQANFVAQSGIKNHDFITDSDDPYKIEVPNLTYKEIRFIDTHLPTDTIESIASPSIPKDDLQKYFKIYRYFPTFVETEI